MKIKIKKLRPDAVLPRYAHGPTEDAGMDLVAVEGVDLYPDSPRLIKTGISIELPTGYEAQIRPRSGWALKYGITVQNSPATIDPGYRGEIGVTLVWNGYKGPHREYNMCPFPVKAGDRIAQMVIARYEAVEWDEADELQDSERGDGGFGSTGR